MVNRLVAVHQRGVDSERSGDCRDPSTARSSACRGNYFAQDDKSGHITSKSATLFLGAKVQSLNGMCVHLILPEDDWNASRAAGESAFCWKFA